MKISVIGSINTDFVVGADKRPKIGETVQGKNFVIKFGGKGANQAVSSARLGMDTTMIGAVGDDQFGPLLTDNLKENNIATDYIKITENTPSGSSVITVVDQDNSIIYVSGANDKVDPDLVDKSKKELLASDLVLLQNESPQSTIEYVIDFCSENKIPVLLNPAPARPLAKEYIDKLTYLTPNETEFEVMFSNKKMDEILKEYPNKLIITLGSAGAIYSNGDEIITVPAYDPTEIIDTTGAGDTFNGAFAVAIVSGLPTEDSIKFANLVASISIQKYGAQSGMPALIEVKENEHYEEKWNIKQ